MNAQQLHTSVGRLPDQFDAPAFQQIHAVIGVAFAENIVALVVFGMLQMRQQFLRLFGRNLLEQRGVQQRRAFATGSTIGLVWRSHFVTPPFIGTPPGVLPGALPRLRKLAAIPHALTEHQAFVTFSSPLTFGRLRPSGYIVTRLAAPSSRSTTSSRLMPVCERIGSTRFTADFTALSDIFSREVFNTRPIFSASIS